MVKQVRRATLLVVLGLGALSGCLFSPDKKPPIEKPPVVYPEAKSPIFALTYMIIAYKERDSVRTAEIYDDAYEGSATDQTGLNPVTYTTTREEEIRHVGHLKLDPNIVSISLDFGPDRTWLRDTPLSGDPPGWAVLHINGAKIEVQDIATAKTYRAQSNPMDYTFIPTVKSAGDTTWKIVRWSELRN